MTRVISKDTHPDGAEVNLTQGAMTVIFTSKDIVIPGNNGVMIEFLGLLTDSQSGYIIGGVEAVNKNTLESQYVASAHSSGVAVVSGILTIQNSSPSPVTYNLVVSGRAYFANTTGKVTNFTTDSIELYPKEKALKKTIPDNNVSYQNYGALVTGTSGTGWVNILTENIPEGNLLTVFGIPINSIKESGTTPIFEYQILKNGVIIDNFDFNPDFNQTGGQFGLRYSVETSEASTIVFRVRCKSAGGPSTIQYHQLATILCFDLDKVGRLVKQRVDAYTPVPTTMLKTPPLDSPPDNTILRIICSNIAANDSFYRSVSYRNSNTFETPVGTFPYPDVIHGSDISSGDSLAFNPAQTTDTSNPRGDFHFATFKQPAEATTPTTLTYAAATARDQKLRPGSAIYLLDLSAEVGPPIEYAPVYYLETS